MQTRRWADQAVLCGSVLASRYFFRSRFLYDIDSVNFALALDRFDPSVHQPQPPGYYLYILLGRLAYAFTHDANAALVALSIAASCGAVAMIYALANAWFGRKAAIFAGAIFVFSPLGWFHGIVALVYIVEAFFAALVGYLCWRVSRGEAALLVPSALMLGLAAGFRPSSLLMLGPLWLFSVWKCRSKRAILGVAALGLTLAAWLVPMTRESGGLAGYLASLGALWRLVPGRQSIFEAGVALALARICTAGAMFGMCFGTGTLALLAGSREADAGGARKVFTAVWILPGLLFFSLVFFKYINSGYLLALTPPAFAWLGCKAASWHSHTRVWKPLKKILLGLFAGANVAVFLAAPMYCTYRGVREFEIRLAGVRRELPRLFSPKDTIIVGFDSHFLGYRHAGYYLPEFLTVQYPEVSRERAPVVFAMENRGTTLLRELPLSRFKSFVFFPLPEGEEYRRYLDGVRRRIAKPPASAWAGGFEFINGDSGDLRYLFPHAAGNAD